MPFQQCRSPEHLSNTYALYPVIVLLLPFNDAVKRTTGYTELCCYYLGLGPSFYQAFAYGALCFGVQELPYVHRNVAEISYALIFKVPVINYGRVT